MPNCAQPGTAWHKRPLSLNIDHFKWLINGQLPIYGREPFETAQQMWEGARAQTWTADKVIRVEMGACKKVNGLNRLPKTKIDDCHKISFGVFCFRCLFHELKWKKKCVQFWFNRQNKVNSDTHKKKRYTDTRIWHIVSLIAKLPKSFERFLKTRKNTSFF